MVLLIVFVRAFKRLTVLIFVIFVKKIGQGFTNYKCIKYFKMMTNFVQNVE